MNQIPTQVSESVRRRNPHLYGGPDFLKDLAEPLVYDKPAKRRIRQSSKPVLNKLEQEWFNILYTANAKLCAQAITFRIANGLRFTPDIFCFSWFHIDGDRPTAWEVKGPWFTDDANAKLKVFAAAYPEIRVFLVWKENGVWRNQIVLP